MFDEVHATFVKRVERLPEKNNGDNVIKKEKMVLEILQQREFLNYELSKLTKVIVKVYPSDANCAECPNFTRPGRSFYLYGCWRTGFISYSGKRRNGSGKNARHGDPAAVDELWRLQHLVHVFDAGSGK